MREDIVKQIMIALIECIEEEGIQKVTVRKIADKARVNPAAINYYFGSKENLIEETLKATLDEAFINNLRDYEDLWKRDIIKAMKGFLGDIFEGMTAYQGLTKAHFSEAFFHGRYDTDLLKKFNEFLENFYVLVSEKLPGSAVLERKFFVVQVLSAIFFPGLFPSLFEAFLGKDFSQKGTRDNYVSALVSSLATPLFNQFVEENK